MLPPLMLGAGMVKDLAIASPAAPQEEEGGPEATPTSGPRMLSRNMTMTPSRVYTIELPPISSSKGALADKKGLKGEVWPRALPRHG